MDWKLAPWILWLIALCAPIFAASAFMGGHSALNQPEPATATTATLYGFAIILAAASIAVLALTTRAHGFVAPWFGFLMVLGIVPALSAMASNYGWFADIGVMVVFAYGGVPTLLVALTWGLILGFAKDWNLSPQPMMFAAFGWLAAIALTAAWLLADLDAQAQRARLAHDTPLGLVIPVAALLLLAWRRR